ncbi:hypothetical protein O181_073295 [Austropuccinia psidii MF-1]|uniref:Chromo domain-containing protein n=1 Tax=Austropuccinia psidii MF-1 TaxID=1389203 RepID=A0A9Q3F276_9BASI|nr:hypothetical protein [Austropuccinia psidii MF-1]
MRESFVGPFTIIKLIGKKFSGSQTQTEIFLETPSLSRQRRMNSPPGRRGPTPPEIVEVEDFPGKVEKIIKARKIRLNGEDQRQYLVRFKNQKSDKDKWLAEDAIPDGNLHLRRFRASRRTEQSHK